MIIVHNYMAFQNVVGCSHYFKWAFPTVGGQLYQCNDCCCCCKKKMTAVNGNQFCASDWQEYRPFTYSTTVVLSGPNKTCSSCQDLFFYNDCRTISYIIPFQFYCYYYVLLFFTARNIIRLKIQHIFTLVSGRYLYISIWEAVWPRGRYTVLYVTIRSLHWVLTGELVLTIIWKQFS